MSLESRLTRLERQVHDRYKAALVRDRPSLPYLAFTENGLYQFATEAELDAALPDIATEDTIIIVDTTCE